MSGGSMDYAYRRVERACEDLAEVNEDSGRMAYVDPAAMPLRAWLVAHLEVVAKALHDIEWADSGDYSPGDEIPALRAVVAHLATAPREPAPEA